MVITNGGQKTAISMQGNRRDRSGEDGSVLERGGVEVEELCHGEF